MTTRTKSQSLQRLLAASLALWLLSAARGASAAGGEAKWLGDELPLPLPVKTPQDIGFKSATERQYLIFNLMAGGKLAYQRGDYTVAVDKWETLLRISALDPQIEKAVAPLLADARAKAGHGGGAHVEPRAEVGEVVPVPLPEKPPDARVHPTTPAVRRGPSSNQTTVSGSVTGGGQIGPGGTVIWLKRLDG